MHANRKNKAKKLAKATTQMDKRKADKRKVKKKAENTNDKTRPSSGIGTPTKQHNMNLDRIVTSYTYEQMRLAFCTWEGKVENKYRKGECKGREFDWVLHQDRFLLPSVPSVPEWLFLPMSVVMSNNPQISDSYASEIKPASMCLREERKAPIS